MKRNGFAIAASAAILASCSGGSMNQMVPSGIFTGTPESTFRGALIGNARPFCATNQPRGYARCFAWLNTDVKPSMRFRPDVAGWGPSDLQTAYSLPSSTNGSGQTVGIVDAFDNPKAENDLGVYRTNFHLAPCTTANRCFKKVDQNGGTTYPMGDHHWGGEIDLDIEMVSAICPKCHIVLVEANDATFHNLEIGEDQAVKQGAEQISNSYGYSESSSGDRHYNRKHVVITASSGDVGYGPQQPCSFATVVCAGGTTLSSVSPRMESGWIFASSGCSFFVNKPKWQHDSGCTKRSESDVSAVANPGRGVAEYDSYGYGGWVVTGGTSVASPIIASAFALAGNAATRNAAKGIWNAGGGPNLNDITTGGANGNCPAPWKYICQPGAGYDGVTGWGSPNGIGAF